ncbi:hypothetical protein UVI_02015770 [Ustilaginoidea virens]|uniref:Amine oxidase domain-containing protein n=1 Tax=Ustilaginoidea virens TaxID=1159556 RepID=A0A1B5KS25_USTVR|nr:hypothetical protein UVI_02015770 [Ustilaginoidea virens]
MGNKTFLVAALAVCAQGRAPPLPIAIDLERGLDARLATVHASPLRRVPGPITHTYGSCAALSPRGADHVVATSDSGIRASRLVWAIPRDAPSGGCISAWDEAGTLVGRSAPRRLSAREAAGAAPKPVAMTEANGFDVLGPWFDGVNALKQRQPGAGDVGRAKKRSIGIVGAGLAGLMTYLVLHQAGFSDVHVLEASDRLGGRVHTEYLSGGPSDYSYQELGAMRLPNDYVDPDSGKRYNMSDTQLVLELVRELNRMNKDRDDDLRVRVVDWIEESDNGLQYFGGIRLPDGLPPTVKQVRNDARLSQAFGYGAETRATSKKLQGALPGRGFTLKMVQNMYKAHREWNDGGLLLGKQKGDRWSEFAFVSQFLGGSLNSTDILVQQQDPQGSFWEYLYDLAYESADTWKMIDGGFSRLPRAFQPLVHGRVRFNTRVERVKHAGGKVTLEWKESFMDARFQQSTFDYAIVSAPFTVVRQWRLPGMGVTMLNAIKNLVYDTNCKVALEYSDRFWEKMANPIFGSCSTTTDIPGIGQFCYPSYNLNGTGPATLLGTYIDASSSHEVARMTTMSEEEHVRYVVDAVAEIHGEYTRRLFTGKGRRKCWSLDPNAVGAFANPSAGQHELYMPEYFKVHKNLGLVDEAKAAVTKWMVPWIKG